MIGKIGYYALIFSFLLSIFILFLIVSDAKNNEEKINKKIFSFSFLQLTTIFVSFICLIFSFIQSDFSLITVYENSHTDKPLFYKIAGVWGNHEGSLLLWIIVLVLFSYLFLISSEKDSKIYRLYTLFFQNLIILGFIFFSLLTSNPFLEVIPKPNQGLGLNPILQDPALAIHPPTLYIGYVSSSIFFSSSLSAMINNCVNSYWAKSIKFWVFISWIFLTLGILLGSIWAYYELGWGGFWFWDPVENVSLMPWLASTALLHSIVILEKRGIFHSWTLVLAIITFSLSMVGTFLVRSGILNSVHTFANDPSRGLYILIFLVSLSVLSVLIFFIYKPPETKEKIFNFFSKETSLLINNWFMVFILLTVLIGTIYPVFLEVINNHKISVGPPFYNIIIIPFVIPFLIIMTIGPNFNWIKNDLLDYKKSFFYLIGLVIIAFLLVYYLIENLNIISLLVIIAALILIFSIIRDIIIYFKTLRFQKEISKLGQLVSHIGFGLLILSIALNSNLSKEMNANLKVGENVNFENFTLTFKSLSGKKEKNYNAIVGNFVIENSEKNTFLLNPEIRIYSHPATMTSEASIKTNFFSDFYITMSYIPEENYYNVRFQHKPFMLWIWISAILISSGGILSIFLRRFQNET